jgi:thiamine monophosphate synthase
VVALGGLDAGRVADLPDRLAGVAVVRALADAADPRAAAAQLRSLADGRFAFGAAR